MLGLIEISGLWGSYMVLVLLFAIELGEQCGFGLIMLDCRGFLGSCCLGWILIVGFVTVCLVLFSRFLIAIVYCWCEHLVVGFVLCVVGFAMRLRVASGHAVAGLLMFACGGGCLGLLSNLL